jgi:MFS family permease
VFVRHGDLVALKMDASRERITAMRRVSPLAPLGELPFVSCWLAGALSASANWMLALSVPYLVYEMTDSTTWLGLAAVASNGPSVLASPLGGVWADRYPKRIVLLATLAVQVVVAASLFWTSDSGRLTVPVLLALAAGMGFASSAHLSAYQSFVAEIVPIRQIAPAYRLNAIQFNVSRAVGPAVAGFVLATGGPTIAFLVNTLAYLPLCAVLLFVRPRPLTRPIARQGVAADLVEGARAVWHDHRLRVAIATAAVVAVFGMSIHPLIAGLAKDVFRVGEQGLGILVSSIGVASVVMALATVWLGDRLKPSTTVWSGLLLYGAGLWVVAATDDFDIGVLGFAITGLAHVLVNVSLTTSVQIHVPEALRGRVTSLQLMAIIVSMPLGAQLGGLLAERVGLSTVVALYAGALVGYAGWASLRLDGLRDLD